jgi:rfaE bifunctional protein kinase chain/domain
MSSKNIEQIFEDFNQLRVLIIGDVMIDSYLWGDVKRISPEAPVPIVNVKKREKRLGGAANVALNVKALGATPILCSIVGQDEDAQALLELMDEAKLPTEGILSSPHRITTIKHRILAGHQHILRVDSELTDPLIETDREQLLNFVLENLAKCDVIIFEDYDKGVLDTILIQQIIQAAHKAKIPTVVDPKKNNFFAYSGATLFKPNLKELREGLKIEINPKEDTQLDKAVTELKSQLNLEQALITLSELGVYLDAKTEKIKLPAHLRSIADVSGAGDTVISVAALSLALGLPPLQLAGLANLAGGLVCEYLGVVPIDKSKLLKEAVINQLFK